MRDDFRFFGLPALHFARLGADCTPPARPHPQLGKAVDQPRKATATFRVNSWCSGLNPRRRRYFLE
jgi:hypothetical protein